MGLDRSEQEQIARHMDHSLSTADRHYDVNTGIPITAKFRQIIEKFHESDLPSESEDSTHLLCGWFLRALSTALVIRIRALQS